jgi:hemoglobin
VDETTLFDRVGGQPFFDELVDRFYDGVILDEVLIAMYPEDLTDSKRHLALFLAQYWGGPPSYSSERGHPRLRMRHAPFRITKRARDAWLTCMRAAVASVADQLNDDDRIDLESYLDMAAHQLRNV